MIAGERKIKKLKMLSVVREELRSLWANSALHFEIPVQARTCRWWAESGKLLGAVLTRVIYLSANACVLS